MTRLPNAPLQSTSTFVPRELFAGLGTLERAQADSYDFGIIRVDDTGKVLLYNRAQSEFAGVPASEAEGKNFFTQVAPCSNNGLFFGSFKKGVASGELDYAFPYTFTFRMSPTSVQIHLYRDPDSGTNWVFCKAD